MRRFIVTMALVLTLLVGACTSEHNLVANSQPTLAPGDEVDVLMVLDNSCSMFGDWNTIAYGLTRVAEDLDDAEVDWQLALTSADEVDFDLFIDLTGSEDPGWAAALAIGDVSDEGSGGEAGFSAALSKRDLYDWWFRDTLTLIIFVSDEHEQSNPAIAPADFLARWPTALTVASIVGKENEDFNENTAWYDPGGCQSEAAPKYHAVADQWIDICSTSPWSVIIPLTE